MSYDDTYAPIGGQSNRPSIQAQQDQTLDLTREELIAQYGDVLAQYDTTADGIIDINELGDAVRDWKAGNLTIDAVRAVNTAYGKGWNIESEPTFDSSKVRVTGCDGPGQVQPNATVSLSATIRNDNDVAASGAVGLGLDGSHGRTTFTVQGNSTTQVSVDRIAQYAEGSQSITYELRDSDIGRA
jgi:hypothetical protein